MHVGSDYRKFKRKGEKFENEGAKGMKSFRRGGPRNVYFSYGRKPFYKPVFIIIVLITYPR
jgi:hypothetical protein